MLVRSLIAGLIFAFSFAGCASSLTPTPATVNARAANDSSSNVERHAYPFAANSARQPTIPCVTIADFTAPTSTDLAYLKAYNIHCVRFDLGAADSTQIASSQAEVKAVAADGLFILLISPYVPKGVTPTQALYDSDASITEQTVALAPNSFAGVELMNEANNDGGLNETQLTTSQYVAYANTIANSLYEAHTYTITSGATTSVSNFLSWQEATVPSISAECIGAHFYGISSSNFYSSLMGFEADFSNKNWCMTEWIPSSRADLATAWSQLNGFVNYFGVFNLKLLEENPSWEGVFPPNSPPY
ncbi:MAG: hypothetical protein IAI50_16180 [Candidatus Eremiobacteraeota bacterium]|nr:hypothetical protein [Candidatus Eremiobacteraeota bacterium]